MFQAISTIRVCRGAGEPRGQPGGTAGEHADGAPELGARQEQPRRHEQAEGDEQRPDGIAR